MDSDGAPSTYIYLYDILGDTHKTHDTTNHRPIIIILRPISFTASGLGIRPERDEICMAWMDGWIWAAPILFFLPGRILQLASTRSVSKRTCHRPVSGAAEAC